MKADRRKSPSQILIFSAAFSMMVAPVAMAQDSDKAVTPPASTSAPAAVNTSAPVTTPETPPAVKPTASVASVTPRSAKPKAHPASGAKPSGAAAPKKTSVNSQPGNDFDPQKVIDDADMAMQKDPRDATAFDRRGSAYNKLEKFDLALTDLNEAIRLDPNLATAYASRAYTYFKLEKYQPALKDCNEAIRLNPNLANAYTCRGNVESKLEQYAKSLADINKGLSLQNKQDEGSLVSRSGTEYLLRNFKAALADASAAIAKNPNSDTAYNNRGVAYLALKQYDAAIKDFNKALTIKPNEPHYICHRGIAEGEQGKLALSIQDLTKAIELKPDFALAYFDRAVAEYLFRQYEKSTKDIQLAIQYDSRYALAKLEFPQDPVKGGQSKPLTQPDEYFYKAASTILMVKNQTALSDLHKYLEMTDWKGDLAQSAVILAYMGNTLNNQTAQAQAVLAEASQKCDSTRWPYAVIRYLKGEIKPAELLAQANDDDKLTDAHAYIGTNMSLNAHRQLALPDLTWAKQKGNPKLVSYSMAVREIEKMQFKHHVDTEKD